MKIKTGDKVKIMVGKDKGRTGKVTKAFPKSGKIIIEGLNLSKKHLRPKKEGEKGQIAEIPKPLGVSRVRLICPSGSKPARVGFARIDGKKLI